MAFKKIFLVAMVAVAVSARPQQAVEEEEQEQEPRAGKQFNLSIGGEQIVSDGTTFESSDAAGFSDNSFSRISTIADDSASFTTSTTAFGDSITGAGSDNSALIGRIVSQLTPLIQSQVSNSFSSVPATATTTTTRRIVSSAPSAAVSTAAFVPTRTTATFVPTLATATTASSASANNDFQGNGHAVYTYSYQVADDNQQTYIAKTEERDGSNVSGEYSYVDPFGDLITVRYTADENGYSETREVSKGFVQIRSRPATASRTVVAAAAPVVSRIVVASDPVVRRIATAAAPVAAPAVVRTVTTSSSNSNGGVSSIFGTGGSNSIRFTSPDTTYDSTFDSSK